MVGEFPENLSVIIGPHIKKESFEVKNDFLNNLKKIGINQKLYIKKKNNLFFFDLSKFLFHKIKSFKIKILLFLQLTLLRIQKIILVIDITLKRNKKLW